MSAATLARDFEAMLTDDDRSEIQKCLEAEASGDPARALHHYYRAPYIEGSPHAHHLHELVDLGADAPAWAYARWAVGQAYRWMLSEHDPRTDRAVIQTIVTCYPDVDLERPLGLELVEFGTRVAASDWMCQQLAVFDYGGLHDFLRLRAGKSLVRRAHQLAAWTESPMGGYRIERAEGSSLHLTDLASGLPLDALSIGALAGHEQGVAVLGRLVPTSVSPGLMFESRPLAVPNALALRVGELVDRAEPDAWLVPLAEARAEGRLPQHFSSCRSTPLTSDLVPDSWSGGPRQDIANGLGVCEVALLAAGRSAAAASVSPHLMAVLVDSGVYAAARKKLTSPEHAEAWDALSGSVPEPVSGRCLELARLSRGASR